MRTSTLVSVFALMLAGCTSQQPAYLDEPVALFYEYEIDRALPLFAAVVAAHPDDATATAYLAETYRRTGQDSLARITAGQALDLDPCQALAHVTLAHLAEGITEQRFDFTTHPSWDHFNQGIECDSTNGNFWMGKWAEAIQRSDRVLFDQVMRKLVDTDFLTPTALAYGRWMLATLPENTILLTNGDMDTFPPEAVQVVEHYRTDVTIIERGLLNYAWGIDFFQGTRAVELGVGETELAAIQPGDAESDPMAVPILAYLADPARSRPVAFAPTVEPVFYKSYANHIVNMGPYLLLSPTPISDDTRLNAIETSIRAVDSDQFTGPWTSAQDYSPVRRHFTPRIARNISGMALDYCAELIALKCYPDARGILDWVTAFEVKTELGPSYQEWVKELEQLLGEQ